MSEWALWSETPDEADEREPPDDAPGAEVDESLETRRLRRWLRSMFGTPRNADGGEDDS